MVVATGIAVVVLTASLAAALLVLDAGLVAVELLCISVAETLDVNDTPGAIAMIDTSTLLAATAAMTVDPKVEFPFIASTIACAAFE